MSALGSATDAENISDKAPDEPKPQPPRPRPDRPADPHPDPPPSSSTQPATPTSDPEPSQTPLVVQGIEPRECEIDGGMQIIIRIHDENSRNIPYIPRVGHKWTSHPTRRSPETIVCHVPPVSEAGSVEVTFWTEIDRAVIQVPSMPYEFKYTDRSKRKV